MKMSASRERRRVGKRVEEEREEWSEFEGGRARKDGGEGEGEGG